MNNIGLEEQNNTGQLNKNSCKIELLGRLLADSMKQESKPKGWLDKQEIKSLKFSKDWPKNKKLEKQKLLQHLEELNFKENNN